MDITYESYSRVNLRYLNYEVLDAHILLRWQKLLNGRSLGVLVRVWDDS
jgi:hypothetical protein